MVKINQKHRFPEIEIGKICHIYNGVTPLRTKAKYWENGNINWFTVSDIKEQGRIIKKTKQKITKDALSETSMKLLPPKTVLLCCTASIGEYAITDIEITTNQQFNGLVIKEEYKSKLIPEFLFIIAERLKKDLKTVAGKTSFEFVSMDNLRNINIALPPIEEQKEIVKTISTWDTAIDNIKKQIIAHNKQRSGILQKLLGKDLKKCPMIALEQIFNIEVVPSKKDVLVEQGKYFVIDMGGVSSSGELIKKKMTDTTEHMLEVNDLIMPKDDIGHGNILGKVAIIDTANKYVLGDHVFRLCNKSQNNIQFLRILINSPKINRSIKRLGNGTSQIGLRKSDILKHLLPIPDIKEQNKISTEALTWERKIYLLETILSKYELQRKGLIQKLLGNITKNTNMKEYTISTNNASNGEV